MPPSGQFSDEGDLVTFSLGTFADSNPSANFWLVDVNWGDATAHTTFTTNGQGFLGSQSHTYGEEGNYNPSITVTNNVGQGGTASFPVTVFDQDLDAFGIDFQALSNMPFTGQTVADFVDPAGAEPNDSDPSGTVSNHYSATIDWGDNSAVTNGTITNNQGFLTVQGDHTYRSSGTFQTSVTIAHESSFGATVNGNVTVSTPTLQVIPPNNQTATEGISALVDVGSIKDSASGANSWMVGL